MAEEFAIDGSFGDSTAVDGEIRTVLASRIGMDDLRKMLLTHTRLTGDEYTQIGAGHLDGYLDIAVELRVLADDSKSLFDG